MRSDIYSPSASFVSVAIERQRGNAAIEFVLILVPLLLLLFAIVSYASFFLLQQRVNHTVGDVARIVSLQRFAAEPSDDEGAPLPDGSYERLIVDRLEQDGWLKDFSRPCLDGNSDLCHETFIQQTNNGDCDWLKGIDGEDAVFDAQKCANVKLTLQIEGWLLTDLLRHVSRVFSDSANWIPTNVSASVLVRLQNNR
ncbi:pilus assembly protein [Paenalcaligenes niemegkensis]|uniref:TadE/TadG family type IV pilus assembly protein n=1 Tax=Paenalcaligenes niemegkensis TaxID=2895469 RepID=UPI00215086F7|nr:TadE/TadG family type IV pilus assembly protein [Paenalcaligenes niemegkensis]MCQ9616993.1 pilus assembly protein [Paenalcaligenes niemegkensis]